MVDGLKEDNTLVTSQSGRIQPGGRWPKRPWLLPTVSTCRRS